MNSSRSTRNVKSRVTRSSEELDLDDSHIIEERLKNLLTNVKEQKQPRNIFNNIQEVPKLRRSVVARAVQNVISSTPMPTEKKRNFFYAENSLNISPIDPISEEAEPNQDKKGQSVEHNEKLQTEYKWDKEAKVILTRASLPIVISDSEDEREVQSILEEGLNQNLSKKVDNEVHYNTRSTDNQKLQNNENLVNGTLTDKRNSKQRNSRNTLSIKKTKSLQSNRRINRTHSKQTEIDSLRTESEDQNKTDKHASLKATPYKSPKSNCNLKHQNVDTVQNATTPSRSESVSFRTSFNNVNEIDSKNVTKRILKPSNCIENIQHNCSGAELVSSSNKKISRLQDNLDIRKNNETTDQSERFIIKTRSQNLSARNKSEKEEPKTVVEEIIKENLPKNKDSQKDLDIKYQKKISPRKLSFASNEDKCNENTSVMKPRNQVDTTKESAKPSKIPISRSRSKSREKNLDENLKNVNNTNVGSLETREKEKIKEHSCRSVQSPPKRPPRKKAQRKKWPISENLLKDKEDTTENVQERVADIMEAKVENRKNEENKKHKINVNSEKTLVEVETFPITAVTPKGNDVSVMKLSRGMVEVGTSTSNHDEETDMSPLTDNEKAERLNQLMSKISQRFQDSLTVFDNSTSSNTKRSPNYSNKRIPVVMTNKEVQTSGKRRNKKKPFNTVELSKKTVMFDSSEHSKSSTLTDHSELIKDLEKPKNPHALFQSLEEELNANFSSSDDEAYAGSFGSNLENRPWRPDENLPIFPRRSSYKLNFLRSAQEIEMERTSQRHNELESDSDTEGMGNAHKKTNVSSRINVIGCATRNRVQIYSRTTQYADEIPQRSQATDANKRLSSPISDLVMAKTDSDLGHQSNKQNRETFLPTNRSQSTSNKNRVQIYSRTTQYPNEIVAQRLQATDANKRLSSPISDLVIAELDSDLGDQSNKQNREMLLPTNRSQSTSNKSPVKSISEAMEKSLEQSKKDVSLCNEDVGEGPNMTLTSSVAKETINVTKSNSRHYTRDKTNLKDKTNANNKKSASFTKSLDYLRENDNDDEVLAVPLEDTNPPMVEEASVRTRKSILKNIKEADKITDSGVEHHPSTEDELGNKTKSSRRISFLQKQNTNASSKKSVVDKPTKAKAQKSKRKKKLPENEGNEDVVSSTTADPEELTGLRRSGRERKTVQRRYYGAITTHSEKILQYYNGLSTTTKPAGKPRTKKRGPSKKDTKGDVTKEPAEKKGKRRQKKKAPSTLELQNSKGISDIVQESSGQPNNLNSSQVEANGIIVNQIDNRTPSGANTNTRARKHRPERDVDSNTHTSQDVIPNKRSKSPESNKSSPADEVNDCWVSPRESPSNSPNANTDAGGTDNNINNNGNNNFPSQSPVGPNADLVLRASLTQDNLHSVGESTTVNKVADKDSGRSTMLKSSTFEESNLRIGKPLTGRINKNYKRKDNVCTKISKVLSRSINNSREHEIFNSNVPNGVDSCSTINDTNDVRSRRSSIMKLKPADSQYITLLTNDNLVSMRYVEKMPKFKLVQDNLMVSDGIKNVKDGGTMGYLKLNPACQKSLHIARKFALFYFVIEGEGFVQVHNKTSKINKLSTFIIPLGIEYSILNTSKDDILVLGFVKMPPCEGS